MVNFWWASGGDDKSGAEQICTAGLFPGVVRKNKNPILYHCVCTYYRYIGEDVIPQYFDLFHSMDIASHILLCHRNKHAKFCYLEQLRLG